MKYDETKQPHKMTQKEYESIVKTAISEVENKILKSVPGFHHTTYFGAMEIHSRHLAIWCFFKKDADLQKAESTGFTKEINQAVQDSLEKHGYPTPDIIYVSFATDEDVQRTCGGNYWTYLK